MVESVDSDSQIHEKQKNTNVAFVIIILCCLVYACLFIYRTSFVIDGERFFVLFDDAMISMTYAKNLAHGHGLVWNPGGERVEGYTNPGWVLYMALFHLFPIAQAKISLCIQLTGIALLLVNLIIVKKISDIVSDNDHAASTISVFLTAFYYPIVFWTLRGMEVSILIPIVGLAVWKTVQAMKDNRVSYVPFVILGIGTLIRPDMVVPFLGILIFWMFAQPTDRFTILATGLAVLFVACSVQVGARLAYYGEWYPNTFFLKTTGYPFLLRISRGILTASALLPTLSLLGFLAPFSKIFFRSNRGALLLVWMFTLQILYSIFVGGDAWERIGWSNRYVTIAMPFVFVLVGTAIGKFGRTLSSAGGNSRSFRRAASASVIILAVTSLLSFNALFGQDFSEWFLLKQPKGVRQDNSNIERAMMIKRITTPDARIAVVWAGTIPYFAERTCIDLLGKCDKKIAREEMRLPSDISTWKRLWYFLPGHLKWDYAYSIGEMQPDVVVQVWEDFDEAKPFLDAKYAKQSFEFSECSDNGDTARIGLRCDMYMLKASDKVLWQELSKVDQPARRPAPLADRSTTK